MKWKWRKTYKLLHLKDLFTKSFKLLFIKKKQHIWLFVSGRWGIVLLYVWCKNCNTKDYRLKITVLLDGYKNVCKGRKNPWHLCRKIKVLLFVLYVAGITNPVWKRTRNWGQKPSLILHPEQAEQNIFLLCKSLQVEDWGDYFLLEVTS